MFGDSWREATVVRFMGLDVGEVRIGVALSDETGLIARGLTTLQRVSWKQDLETLMALIDENQVGHIVVGHPLNLDGSQGPQADKIADFVGRLREATAIEISLWDERLSSSSAERVLLEGGVQRGKRKQIIDKLAAVIILQNFLDHRNCHSTPG
jgi:putative holliday junction resolvase